MVDDKADVIDFGQNSVLKGQLYFVLNPGHTSDSMHCEHEYDLLQVIDGQGKVRSEGRTQELLPGSKIRMPNGARYLIESSLDSKLIVTIYSVDSVPARG